jgi:hypothetical protein
LERTAKIILLSTFFYSFAVGAGYFHTIVLTKEDSESTWGEDLSSFELIRNDILYH